VIYKLQWKTRSRFAITPTFDDWLSRLKDARAQAKIAIRIDRLAAGNFGDCKPLRHGLCELRIDWGPGYRVYYAMVGRTCILLLSGGDKRKQSSDIDRALEFLKDYKERTGAHET
jgi:putative addiction module killer protein